ncbi:MATE family efflux transporter [Eubacterium limosum]|uniref:Multidrug export protein MepA n=1 Tax=Eubacterium limosum TaxID=1736 RepID=A0ABT5US38_EUBLI|nr:MATE family efflux transporter [Eubacterium limosum]MCB6570769.1 MATE family efflux transporter [Eubacterium limosum]MDE1471769.1 MATE family efflux transporter [Eubacterium limosum]
MDNEKNTELGTMPVGRLMFKLALPAIVAQVINALYNIVDRMYIGHIEGVGPMALTGVGITFPIIMLITAFAAMIGMGGAPLAAIHLGEKNRDGAEGILGNAATLLLILSVVLTAFFLIFQRPLLMAFGASENTIEHALQYMTIYLCGTIFVMATLGLNSFINTQGFAKTGMLTVLIGAVLNIILDPVFIFVFGMGVRGAALATILSQAVSAIWVCRFLIGKKTTIKIKPSRMRLKKEYVVGIISLGISPFIMQSTESLLNITLNASLQFYGGDLAVGAMTIIGSISQLGLMPLMGLTQGGQPIISYNYGARNYDRVRKAYHLMIAASFTLSMIIWAIVEFFPEVVIAIFTTDPQLSSLTVWAIRIFMMCIGIMGLQTGCQQTFLSLGQAKVSVFLAMLRKLILLIPLILIIPRVTGLGMTGVFLAQPIADFIAVVSTVAVFAVKIRKIIPRPAKTA